MAAAAGPDRGGDLGQLAWMLTDGRALTDHELVRLVDDMVTPGP